MGNRGGRIHNPATRSLGKRRWASKQWICCVLEFKNRRRHIMGHSYTELFFYDEASALAAGHRPCFECRRKDAITFAKAWAKSKDSQIPPKAAMIDAILHAERLSPRDTKPAPSDYFIDGIFFRQHGTECVFKNGTLHPWSPTGYDKPIPVDRHEAQLLTPVSICGAIKAGYNPDIRLDD